MTAIIPKQLTEFMKTTTADAISDIVRRLPGNMKSKMEAIKEISTAIFSENDEGLGNVTKKYGLQNVQAIPMLHTIYKNPDSTNLSKIMSSPEALMAFRAKMVQAYEIERKAFKKASDYAKDILAAAPAKPAAPAPVQVVPAAPEPAPPLRAPVYNPKKFEPQKQVKGQQAETDEEMAARRQAEEDAQSQEMPPAGIPVEARRQADAQLAPRGGGGVFIGGLAETDEELAARLQAEENAAQRQHVQPKQPEAPRRQEEAQTSSTQLYQTYKQALLNDVRDDTINWLAVHTEAPVNSYTSRDEKVQFILQKLQGGRVLDLLPSLLLGLGAADVAFRLGNYQKDVSTNRTLLLYKMFNQIGHDGLQKLYMFTGTQENRSLTAPQQFSDIFKSRTAESMKALFGEPLLSLAHVRNQIDPIYQMAGIPSAALGGASLEPQAVQRAPYTPPPAKPVQASVVQPAKPAPTAKTGDDFPEGPAEQDVAEKAFYQAYRASDRGHQAFVTLKFAIIIRLDKDTITRLRQHYNAPVRIQDGLALLGWLEGQAIMNPDPANRDYTELANNPKSIERFISTYRKYRKAATSSEVTGGIAVAQGPMSKPGDATSQAIESALATYRSSFHDRMQFISWKWATAEQLDRDPATLKRLIELYGRVPVRIKKGEELIEWLEGQPDAAGRGPLLSSKLDSIELFIATYRKAKSGI